MEECGRTYAEEAGIRLKGTPQPLYQLLVLSLLPSARIGVTTSAPPLSSGRAHSSSRTPGGVICADCAKRPTATVIGRRTRGAVPLAGDRPLPRFAAALVRAALDKDIVDAVTEAARAR